jgi:hypothetical protein
VHAHRMFDGFDIRLDRVIRPGGVDTQHRTEALSVLLGDPQLILASQKCPAH